MRSQCTSIYLLNGFVHFLSSLDLSELAKAAKKKLQSVSISSLGTPVWNPVGLCCQPVTYCIIVVKLDACCQVCVQQQRSKAL